MARPIKQGLEYFSFDTDFFSDVKIRKIIRAYGPSSTSILICLLCNIYKDKGYYILWDEDLPFVIADSVGVSEGAVADVIKKAIQVGFFDESKFEEFKILTSHGIQKRFIGSTSKRKDVELNKKYLLVEVKGVNDGNNGVNDGNNPVNDSRSTQSKVKESKEEKESTKVDKKKNTVAAKAATLSRKEEFGKSLIPFIEKYSKEMIRAFFDYWSEMTRSETKMRFEKQPTWEVGKRLATWASKEKITPHGEYAKKQHDSEQRKLDSITILSTKAREEAAQRRKEFEADCTLSKIS